MPEPLLSIGDGWLVCRTHARSSKRKSACAAHFGTMFARLFADGARRTGFLKIPSKHSQTADIWRERPRSVATETWARSLPTHNGQIDPMHVEVVPRRCNVQFPSTITRQKQLTHLKRDLCHALLLIVQVFSIAVFAANESSSAGTASTEELQRLFKDPPDDSRIMMRWWWFGPAVQQRELERELRAMKAGGIGGVEVQPVYPLALDDPKNGIRNLPYLSDEFLDALRFAFNKAKELGLRFDLTLGSGWPYGGPQVPITEAAGALRMERIDLDGHSRAVPLPNIVNGEKLLAAFLVPSSLGPSKDGARQITDIHDGMIFVPAEVQEHRQILI